MGNPLVDAINEARIRSGNQPGPPAGGYLPSRAIGSEGEDEARYIKPQTEVQVDYVDVEEGGQEEQQRIYSGGGEKYVSTAPAPEPTDQNVIFLDRNIAFWNSYVVHLTSDELEDIQKVVNRGAIRQLKGEQDKLSRLFPMQKTPRKKRKKDVLAMHLGKASQ